MNSAYQLNNLTYAYDEDIVLQIDSHNIEKNSITALLGPNGSGKSTLLNILAFLNKPVSGEVTFMNRPVEHDDYASLRRRIAYVQQKPYLFNTSVMENIVLGLKLRGVERQERLAEAEKVIRLCDIERLVQRRAHELSGGEVQKVAIARALILAPEVLILDEPFSHLDRKFRLELEELLRELKKKRARTVIFSSHEQVQAQQLADHVCSLDHGRLVPTAEVNLFRGEVHKQDAVFDTGRIKIHIPGNLGTGQRLAIESNHLVISRDKLASSMRNSYPGRVKSLKEEGEEIRLVIEAGEEFHAMITHAALQELGINIGDRVWVSFKSTAVRVY